MSFSFLIRIASVHFYHLILEEQFVCDAEKKKIVYRNTVCSIVIGLNKTLITSIKFNFQT